jgi:hypothetical protein
MAADSYTDYHSEKAMKTAIVTMVVGMLLVMVASRSDAAMGPDEYSKWVKISEDSGPLSDPQCRTITILIDMGFAKSDELPYASLNLYRKKRLVLLCPIAPSPAKPSFPLPRSTTLYEFMIPRDLFEDAIVAFTLGPPVRVSNRRYEIRLRDWLPARKAPPSVAK